jgi:hypothetical protein
MTVDRVEEGGIIIDFVPETGTVHHFRMDSRIQLPML